MLDANQEEVSVPLETHEVIHIAQVVMGPTPIRTELLVIKSILRFYKANHGGLHFHLITDEVSKIPLQTFFTTWAPAYVKVTFYDSQQFHVSLFKVFVEP